MTRDQWRPFGFGLLHPIFAEHPLSSRNDRFNRLDIEGFRNRHQRYRRRIASGVAAGARDFRAHGRKSATPVPAFHFVNAFWKTQSLVEPRTALLRASTSLRNRG